MLILYVKEDFNYAYSDFKKDNFIIIADYRAPWYTKLYPVEIICHFRSKWGSKPCVTHYTEFELYKFLLKIDCDYIIDDVLAYTRKHRS